MCMACALLICNENAIKEFVLSREWRLIRYLHKSRWMAYVFNIYRWYTNTIFSSRGPINDIIDQYTIACEEII